MTFTIPLAPVTKKNSQRIVHNKKTGKPFVLPSAAYAKYASDARRYLPYIDRLIDYPVEITCRFYMPTRRKTDLTNLLEAIDDVLVGEVIRDDNSSIIVSHDGSRVLYDKDYPRTEITIRNLEEHK